MRRPASPSSASGRLRVEVVSRQRKPPVGSTWLAGIVRRALRAEGIGAAEITVVLLDDHGIAALHGEWMDDPTPTDVITFDLSGPEDDGVLRGDIAVSTETAARMAGVVGWTARLETTYYVLHGILHLVGHDDLAPGPRRAMRRRERTLLESLGLPVPPRPRATTAGKRR